MGEGERLSRRAVIGAAQQTADNLREMRNQHDAVLRAIQGVGSNADRRMNDLEKLYATNSNEIDLLWRGVKSCAETVGRMEGLTFWGRLWWLLTGKLGHTDTPGPPSTPSNGDPESA